MQDILWERRPRRERGETPLSGCQEFAADGVEAAMQVAQPFAHVLLSLPHTKVGACPRLRASCVMPVAEKV